MKKRIIPVVLLLAMLLTLTACGGDQEKLVGSWECEMDMSDLLNSEMALDEEAAQYINFDSFEIIVCMEFNSDGTYSMHADMDAMEAAIENARVQFAEGMGEYMEALFVQTAGVEMSIDDILALSGLTMDDLVAEAFPDSIAEEVAAEMAQEGNFKVKDGKLFTSAGLDYAVDPEVYETYVLEEDVLTLTGYVGDDAAESFNVYPMVFNKVA